MRGQLRPGDEWRGEWRVLVGTCCAGDAVLVAVEDDGEGIAPEDLPRVFERFYRGDKARSRERGDAEGDGGGAGLGLAISKGIVEAHGGAIWAEPRAPRGTRVAFTLPLAPEAARQ